MESKKKILLVTHSSLEYGGAEEGFDEMISHFSADNELYEVYSMFPEGKRADNYISKSFNSIIYKQVFLPVAKRPLKEYYRFMESFFYIKNIIEKNYCGLYFDACIINVSVLIWHILFLRKYTRKLIVYVKETIEPYLLRKIVYKLLNKYCDFVYFVSEDSKKEFDTINKSETKTGITYSPINDINYDSNIYSSVFNELGSIKKIIESKQVLKLICLGSIDKRKNQMMIIKSVEILKKQIDINLHLFLVGDYSKTPDYTKLVKKEIEKSNLNNIVTLTGNMSKKQYSVLLSKCDVLIMSSLSEGIPIVLIEACGYKKIVVCTDLPSIKSFIKNGKNGFLVNKTPESLAKRLNYIYENFESMEDIRKNAYETYIYYKHMHDISLKELEKNL